AEASGRTPVVEARKRTAHGEAFLSRPAIETGSQSSDEGDLGSKTRRCAGKGRRPAQPRPFLGIQRAEAADEPASHRRKEMHMLMAVREGRRSTHFGDKAIGLSVELTGDRLPFESL